MKAKVPTGYRSKNLVDRRGEFKRKETAPAFRYQAGERMEANIAKMGTRARKNVNTPRNRANLKQAFSDKRRG